MKTKEQLAKGLADAEARVAAVRAELEKAEEPCHAGVLRIGDHAEGLIVEGVCYHPDWPVVGYQRGVYLHYGYRMETFPDHHRFCPVPREIKREHLYTLDELDDDERYVELNDYGVLHVVSFGAMHRVAPGGQRLYFPIPKVVG